jgi:hypothetical protein
MNRESNRRACRSKPENWSKAREENGRRGGANLALAGLKTSLGLIDDVNAPLSAHDTVVAVPAAERFQRITDFHNRYPDLCRVD